MEFELVHNGTRYRIQVEDGGKGSVRKVSVNDRTFEVDVTKDGSVKIGSRSYQLKIKSHKLELGKAHFELELDDKPAVLEALVPHVHKSIVQDSSNNIAAPAAPGAEGKAAKSQTERKPAAAAAPGSVFAPMPGRLVALKVGVGDKVKSGQVVAILEAMKMENELKAAKGGRVKSINYRPGENVVQGKAIMIIE
jgi:biotin carboxyl carrier protein